MSEEKNPEVLDVATEVPENDENTQINYSEKSLAELADMFMDLARNPERMKMNKEAEAIKSAFYKNLAKEKAAAGIEEPGIAEPQDEADAAEPGDGAAGTETLAGETGEDAAAATVQETGHEEPDNGTVSENPFAEIERGFKALYNAYRKERAEYNRQQEKEREHNLEQKEAVIRDLKALIEKQEDVNRTFPEFREIQNRWRAIGPVPVQSFRNLNDTYQLYVEQFYDMVKINRELRDLDFKKNLEVKTGFCEQAEKLAESENVVESFRELQKLHEQWKEFGPVAKEFREQIWDRFKAATAVINKKYQAYFEGLKEQHAENLAAKTRLCEQVEEIASRENIPAPEWNTLSKEIEDIQKQWKTIGFASKKENQKIYDRFRAACDKFFGKKREFYAGYKENINANLEKKIALCEAAEALKDSTDWKKTANQLINLQKQWKEIGAVPRKKSEQLWKRFRAACDAFFNERDKNVKPENDFYGNLKAKQHLIEEIEAYVLSSDEDTDTEAMNGFMQRWQEIGFVPFKEKDNIAARYKDALQSKFGNLASKARKSRYAKAPKSEKERLVQKYLKKEQDITTYENNIGFFAMSKNSEPLIMQMRERIEQAKKELKELEEQIRAIDSASDAE